MEFNRFELLIKDKYLKLKDLNILVIGVGGVGGYLVESLVRCGILNITIVDHDIVDITNINRQIIALHSTIGRKKVEVLKERILDINKNVKVKALDMFYDNNTKDKINILEYDYIFDCCDSVKSKELLIREAVNNNIKIVSSMGAGFKFHPEKIKLTKLKNTNYDKIAKILRYNLKDDKKYLEIPVVFSDEVNELKGDVIASNSYIPCMFGLYMTSYLVNDIVGDKNEI